MNVNPSEALLRLRRLLRRCKFILSSPQAGMGGSRGGGPQGHGLPPIGRDIKTNRATFWQSSQSFSIRGPPQSKILEPPMPSCLTTPAISNFRQFPRLSGFTNALNFYFFGVVLFGCSTACRLYFKNRSWWGKLKNLFPAHFYQSPIPYPYSQSWFIISNLNPQF